MRFSNFIKKGTLFATFFIAILIRFLFIFLTRSPGHPIFNTPDAFYHARRVLVTVNNFPHLPLFDFFISYPTGGYCIWPPLFDFFAAFLTYVIFLGKPLGPQIEWICAIYPILFSLAVMILLYFVAKKVLNNESIAILSLFLFAVLPAAFLWTKLGYFDHHIAETFGLLLIFYMLILIDFDEKLTYWILTGLCYGVALLLWQGSILFIGFAFFTLLLQRRYKASISFIISILIILPFSINTHYPDSPFSYRGLSLLHISLLSMGTLILLIPLLWRKSKLIAAIPTGLLIILLFLLFRIPSYVKGIFFLFKKDPWLATIIEFQPLVIRSGYLTTLPAKQIFGLAYFLSPFILIIMIIDYWKKNKTIIPYAIFTVLTGGLSFIGGRFGVWFIPFYVILFAFILKKIIDLFGKRFGFIIAIIIFVVNFYSVKKEIYQQSTDYPNPDELRACQWLNDSTPATRGFLNPREKPEYGVLCFWGCGHFIVYLAKRPVAASNFGNDVPNFNIVNQFFIAESEEEARNIMDTLNCRYAFITDDMFFVYLASKYLQIDAREFLNFYYVKPSAYDIFTVMEPNDRGIMTTNFRLAHNLGSGFFYKDKFITPYRHFRLRFVSGNVRIFEYVKGAVIKGNYKPKETIKITNKISLGPIEFQYLDIITTDEEGRFSVVVPYPNDNDGYELIIDNKEINVRVSESMIMNGDSLTVNL